MTIVLVALAFAAGRGEAGLLAYYPFDRDFSDASGNSNHLAVAAGIPAITTVTGAFAVGGGALDLDSTTSNEVYLNLESAITFGAGDAWSVAFWGRRRPGADHRQGMVIGDSGNSTDFIWIPDNPAQVQGLRFRNSSNTNADYGSFPDDGQWHHWVVISNGSGQVSAYRDNMPLGSVSTPGSFSIASVGQAYNAAIQSMNGQIDELHIYDEVIDAAMVEDLFTASSGSDPGPPSEVNRLRVVLIGGQSNADGRGDPAGLPTSPVNLQQPQDDVDYYYGSTLTTLRPLSQFGPEIMLGRRFADSIGDGTSTRVAIIKYGVGGTSLKTDWKAGGDASTSGDGPRYVTFQQVVDNGLAALAAAYPGAVLEIEGMVWVQGENDARNGYQDEYAANLVAFIADVRGTYGADLPFVVVRLSSGQTDLPAVGLDGVRAAQTAVAAADPRAPLVDTDHFGLKTDALHFDALGQQQIGAASVGRLLAFAPITTTPVLVMPGNGDIVVTVNGAFPGFLYTLQTSLTLQPSGWADVESVTAAGPLVAFTFTPPAGEAQRFFRVGRSSAP